MDDPAIILPNSDIFGHGNEDESIEGTLRVSDVDSLENLEPFSIKRPHHASFGSVAIDAFTGVWKYTPEPNFNGNDSFTVTITDDNQGTAEMVIGIQIDAINDSPTASGTPILSSIKQDSTNSDGDTVSNLFEGLLTDADQHHFIAIAVHANAATKNQGVWQYSTNEGRIWETIEQKPIK